MRSAALMIALGIGLAATCATPARVHAEEGAALSLDSAPLVLGHKLVDTETLAQQRGGADTHLSEIRAVGSVADVKAYDLTTGQNVISEGSFAGTAGMPLVVQNSGNGVLIQNAVILNVEVH